VKYEEERTAHNGSVYAIGAKNAAHFFMLNVKRRIRSERYAQCSIIFLKILDIIKFLWYKPTNKEILYGNDAADTGIF
jgi:hypothetical protein